LYKRGDVTIDFSELGGGMEENNVRFLVTISLSAAKRASRAVEK